MLQVLIYLSEVIEGGETIFKKEGVNGVCGVAAGLASPLVAPSAL